MKPSDKADNDRCGMIQGIMRDFGEQLIERGWFRSCLNCEHWIGNTEQCALYKARPPAKVIVVGCESHSDLIPF